MGGVKEVRGGGNEGGFERKKELIFERFITLWQSKVNYLSTPPPLSYVCTLYDKI